LCGSIACPSNLFIYAANSSNPIIIASESNVGIGTLPMQAFQLTLSGDAAKPNGGVWSTTSDIRLKSDIIDADTAICYQTIKGINLKRFKWITKCEDMHKLGWIAQDVARVFPKSVRETPAFDLPDCKVLNADQLYAALYGCVRELIIKVEKNELDIKKLNVKVVSR
jgi:hypothetical protein